MPKDNCQWQTIIGFYPHKDIEETKLVLHLS